MDKPGKQNKLVRRTAQLQTGQILTEHPSGIDSESLFGFGERINPRRSFVFVSRVLGRHIPVTPGLARHAFATLAQHLNADLEGPVLITSMAETAVGLGAGVHDAYVRRTGRKDVLNFSSTRTARPQAVFGSFSEDHSHASGHTLYSPALDQDRKLLLASRTLVMVDDETSSGNTFRSLGCTLNNAGLDHFNRIITLTLTDWSSETIRIPSKASASGQLEAERYSLLSGRYSWTARPDAPVMTLPDPDVPSRLASTPVHRTGDARVGNSGLTPIHVSDALLQTIEQDANDERPVLVLGTGEHVWEPFLLAEALEQHGIGVKFSATTRSPILIGHEIQCAYHFNDHEELGIRNYLYNVDPQQFSTIIVCVDTRLENLDPGLLKALGAHVVFDGQFIKHSTLSARTDAVSAAVLEMGEPTDINNS